MPSQINIDKPELGEYELDHGLNINSVPNSKKAYSRKSSSKMSMARSEQRSKKARKSMLTAFNHSRGLPKSPLRVQNAREKTPSCDSKGFKSRISSKKSNQSSITNSISAIINTKDMTIHVSHGKSNNTRSGQKRNMNASKQRKNKSKPKVSQNFAKFDKSVLDRKIPNNYNVVQDYATMSKNATKYKSKLVSLQIL